MEQEDTVDVSSTGLHIHPTLGFLAASPDRLVTDTSDGVLEVKYLVSINGQPDDAIRTKSNY